MTKGTNKNIWISYIYHLLYIHFLGLLWMNILLVKMIRYLFLLRIGMDIIFVTTVPSVSDIP